MIEFTKREVSFLTSEGYSMLRNNKYAFGHSMDIKKLGKSKFAIGIEFKPNKNAQWRRVWLYCNSFSTVKQFFKEQSLGETYLKQNPEKEYPAIMVGS